LSLLIGFNAFPVPWQNRVLLGVLIAASLYEWVTLP